MQEQVPAQCKPLLDLTVDRMLAMVDRGRFHVSRDGDGRTITIAGATIVLNPAAPTFQHQLERLASAIAVTIAYERALAMLAAVGATNGPLPLWLVSGSSVLARWIAWSRSDRVLCRALQLSAKVDDAPVTARLRRTARAPLGQAAVNIRVRNGLAVAEKIELPGQQRCVLALGRTARLTITSGRLPETIVAALGGCHLTQLASHPFFNAANLVIAAARNEGQSLIVELDHDWRPLAAVPEAALAVMPADADPARPWRPTPREVADLYGLVDGLREHGRFA